MLMRILVGGILIVVFGLCFILTQLYSSGGVMSRLALADQNRLSVTADVSRSSVASCQVVKDVSIAVDNFATSWLPPDVDYLRTHPHENSFNARFHKNRVDGLTKLQQDMVRTQNEACENIQNSLNQQTP
jgi:hypothetical protein